MKLRCAAIMLALVLATATACTRGTEEIAPLFDAEAFAQRAAETYCAFYERCEPSHLAQAFGTRESCVAEQTLELLTDYLPYESFVMYGGARYDPALLEACFAVFDSGECIPDFGLASGCSTFLRGALEAGAACLDTHECRPGLACMNAEFGTCGVCREASAPRWLGESCSWDDSCFSNLECVDGVCTKRLEVGAACTIGQRPSCNVFATQACIDGTCADAPIARHFEPCDEQNTRCADREICHEVTHRCVSGPNLGDACSFSGGCADDSFCEDHTICTARKGDGAACRGDVECARPLRCVDGTCGTYVWRECP